MSASMIQVRGLEKSFPELPVLRGVDFEVARGSIFALLGSNGAGKTTIVRILSTLLRLIRIRTLAAAGVPLARVGELLDAAPEMFAAATAEIDRQLAARNRALRQHRRQITRLGSGESLAVPAEVAGYLDRLAAVGAPAPVVDGERDAWILVAARWPEAIPAVMADKMRQLDDPKVVRFYRLMGRLAEAGADDRLAAEVADVMAELLEQAAAAGAIARQEDVMPDARFVRLLDAFADDSHPGIRRVRELMAERGWTGWVWMQRRDP